ncbi:hypothetical protein VNO77_46359 [Canavalia gladiata]|uniref:Uncharacterized protein n=1 Tax=Canavalia gladiata TaxID=3824 RepID=A0AAN9JE36_CANGL
MALYLPLSAGAYFDKLQDQWLKLLLLQRFSCDLFSFRPCSCTHLKEGLLVITEGMTKELLLRAIDFPTEMERMRSYSLSIADAKTKRA